MVQYADLQGVGGMLRREWHVGNQLNHGENNRAAYKQATINCGLFTTPYNLITSTIAGRAAR